MTVTDAITEAARRIAARGASPPRAARDPVNLPMVRNWVEAIGDDNPVYTDADRAARTVHGGLVAPPAMVQVWTMRGLRPADDPDDPLRAMSEALDEAGFTSVVATNCEQTYHRYLRPGEQVAVRTRLESAVGPKRTALGEGWFITTRSIWYVGAEAVAEMLFRVLKFRPPAKTPPGTEPPASAAPSASTPPGAESPASEPSASTPPGTEPPATEVLRPLVTRDTAFFWAGTAAGELRLWRCGACGLLRHPPGPMCPHCHSLEWEAIRSSGRGHVFSYVIAHHPPVPPFSYPNAIALVELDEGTRLVSNVIGIDPADLAIGMRVHVEFTKVDDELVLPLFRPDLS